MDILPIHADSLYRADQNLVKANYQTLFQRKKWQHFKADSEGRLVLMSAWENLQYFFSPLYRQTIQAGTKRAIEQVFREMRMPTEPGDEFLSQIENLFLRVRSLSKNVFDRATLRNSPLFVPLRERVITYMRDVREEQPAVGRRVMAERVSIDRKLMYPSVADGGQPVDAYNPEATEENPRELHEKQFWQTMAEAQIASWLFSSFKRNSGGTSGNYRIMNLEERVVGIFKPVQESPHGPLNPYFWIRMRNMVQTWFGFDHDRAVDEENGHLREQFASVVAEELGWVNEQTHQPLVPRARIGRMKSLELQNKVDWQEGSIQFFIERARDGFTHFQVPEWTIIRRIESYYPPTDEAIARLINQIDFYRIAIIDYLLGNIDFNLGNVLFVEDNKVHAIDFWFSMPLIHPKRWLDTRNMHRWKALSYANHFVREDIKRQIETVWNRIVFHARRHFGEGPTMDCFTHRKTVLINFVGALKDLPSNPGDWNLRYEASRDLDASAASVAAE